MLRGAFNLCLHQPKLLVPIRNLTATEVSTALRPFYFSVHPDLFGQYPNERATNENSLQQLSALLNMLQASRPVKPTNLNFYLKDKTTKTVSSRLIKIDLKERDVRSAILNILKTCELPTDYVDSIPKPPPKQHRSSYNVKVNTRDIDFTKVNRNHPIYASFVMQRKIKEAKEAVTLRNWLKKNFEDALKKSEGGRASKYEIERLKTALTEALDLKEIQWDCGWNNTHFRGCLLAFKSLVEQHAHHMHVLKGRTLVFSYFTGVSIDGHIMLYTGEVRHNWLDFIKNIKRHDQTLTRIPAFEKSLSHILRNIKVGRRKFMPKVMAAEYEKNLKQITTALSDYLGRKTFPKKWPESFEKFEIVVESEAGPLMVSPTGQFIVPAALPGTLLVNFITDNLEEALQKTNEYKSDKYVEKSLLKKCMEELQLSTLSKEDNVTPNLMIKCCNSLLESKYHIEMYTKGIQLNITTYYSVLSDGVTCIPWNFKL